MNMHATPSTGFGLNPNDELNDLRMSDKARPLYDHVRKFLKETVAPVQVEYEAAGKGKTDRWSFTDKQLELLDKIKSKAKSEGLWNFFLPDSETGEGLSNLDYAFIAAELGKYPLGSESMNCSAPDTGNMEVLERVGTKEQKEKWLKPLLNGEIRSAYVMTEPNVASSDAKNVSTTAKLDGDEWVINGQKVWTSGAHYSDFGILLVRTDPKVPKHKGLTMFIVNMKQKGVEARPIHQASGGREFNEVYFTDVRIPDSDRLGEVGAGWKVALVTLMNERLAVGGSPGPDWAEIMDYARQSGTLSDQAFREKLADWYVAAQGYKLTKFRTQTALSRGQTPGPENSIGKIITANHLQDICNSAIEMQDHYGIITESERMPADAIFQQSFMWAPGLRIAGGTDEILKNIIAERVLGLPQDVRVDKDVPFDKIPTSGSRK